MVSICERYINVVVGVETRYDFQVRVLWGVTGVIVGLSLSTYLVYYGSINENWPKVVFAAILSRMNLHPVRALGYNSRIHIKISDRFFLL